MEKIHIKFTSNAVEFAKNAISNNSMWRVCFFLPFIHNFKLLPMGFAYKNPLENSAIIELKKKIAHLRNRQTFRRAVQNDQLTDHLSLPKNETINPLNYRHFTINNNRCC
jgi:hypothetical protein